MRITLGTNISALAARRRLNQTAESAGRVSRMLASGQRIVRASDDAAGLAIATSLEARSRIYNQAARNVSDAASLITITGTAIRSLQEIAARQQELASQAANGSYSAMQRRALNQEAQALSLEYSRIVEGSTFNGRPVFSLGSTTTIQAGIGEAQTLELPAEFGISTLRASGSFSSGTYYTSAEGVQTCAVADFNGDGVEDFATQNQDYANGSSVTVFNGLGDGTFFVNGAYSTGETSRYLIAEDFNHDGRPDIATANNNTVSGNLFILMNNGDGTFSDAVTYMSGAGSSVLACGDFNRDGHVDIAALGEDTSEVRIFSGIGDGTFIDTGSFTAGDDPYSMTAADVDNDGNVDLAITDAASLGVHVFRGVGDGSFAPGAWFQARSWAFGVEAADLNNDGSVDLVVKNVDSFNVLLNNGSGSFSTAVSQRIAAGELALFDGNGDGITDIVTSSSTGSGMYFEGKGDGTFLSGSARTFNSDVEFIASADFDQDGLADILTSYMNGGAWVYRGVSTLTFKAPSLSLETQSDALLAVETLSAHTSRLALAHGAVGAVESRLAAMNHTAQRLSVLNTEAKSRITDADMASETARFVTLQIGSQLAAAIAAQANQNGYLALELLK